MKWLISAFAVLLAVLLIGNRLGFAWAGGEPMNPLAARVEASEGALTIDRDGDERPAAAGDALRRGEIVRTGAEGRALIAIGSIRIALAANTDLELVDLAPATLSVKLPRGRILADNPDAGAQPLFLETNRLTASLGPRASVVNYDFRGIVSIAPINGAVGIALNQERAIITPTPVDIAETADPPEVTDAAFDIADNAEADFYAWALERLD